MLNTYQKNGPWPGCIIHPGRFFVYVCFRKTKSNGSFSEIEELKKVSGFGASKFEKVKDKITI